MSSKVITAAQTGILLSGPGGLRASELQANLVNLTPEQQELVNKAKKYALDISVKSILLKQTITNQQQQQKSLQRHQALVLMCRVYVGSISFELKEETIKAAFAPFGAIKSINMSWDAITLKHKGFAFVEYELPEAAQLALEHMNGIQLGGRQIKVGRPSNMPQAAPVIQQIQEECKEKNRIYVSNVHPKLALEDLSNIFDPFGAVRSCKLATTPNVDQPQHRGYGFIEFETEGAAIEALTMDNFDLGGQALHVCRATTPAENLSIYGTLETESIQAPSISNTSEEDIQLQLERANNEQENNQTESDNELQNVLTAVNAPNEVTKASQDNTSSTNGISSYEPSVIVLRNMIGSDEEIDDSLQLDVYDECSKHGTILQVVIYVDKGCTKNRSDNSEVETNIENSDSQSTRDNEDNQNRVKIFVKYKDSNGSDQARAALNGRFFAGRKVSAEHYDRSLFRLSDYSH